MDLVHPLLTKAYQPRCAEPLARSSALPGSQLPLTCTHSPFGRAQDTARGQLGGSQEFVPQCLGAYQWTVVRLGIPELLSHIFSGNYKSPSAEPGVLQYLALCNSILPVLQITGVAIFALLETGFGVTGSGFTKN